MLIVRIIDHSLKRLCNSEIEVSSLGECELIKHILELFACEFRIGVDIVWLNLADGIVGKRMEDFCLGNIKNSIIFVFIVDFFLQFWGPCCRFIAELSLPLEISPWVSYFKYFFAVEIVCF